MAPKAWMLGTSQDKPEHDDLKFGAPEHAADTASEAPWSDPQAMLLAHTDWVGASDRRVAAGPGQQRRRRARVSPKSGSTGCYA
jgi:hypothetical protein